MCDPVCNWHPKVKEMKVAQSRLQSWLLGMQHRGFAVESTRGEPYVWFILLAVSFVSSGVGSSWKRAKWIFFLVLPDTLALTYTEVPWGMNLWNYSACGGTASQVGLEDCYPRPHSMRCLCSQMWHSFLIGLFWDLITRMVGFIPICGDFTLLTSHFFFDRLINLTPKLLGASCYASEGQQRHWSRIECTLNKIDIFILSFLTGTSVKT